MATVKNDLHIRWMIRRDMAEVLEIEQLSFQFPWSEEDFIRVLRCRNSIGMVYDTSGPGEREVLAFVIYELEKTVLRILDIAVHPSCRRRGVGAEIIQKMKRKLSRQRRNRILLEIRESNTDAQLFFRQMGFRAVTVLKDFYEESTEDAYLFQYRHRAEDDCDSDSQ